MQRLYASSRKEIAVSSASTSSSIADRDMGSLIEPQGLQELARLDDVLVLDARGPADYAKDHVPGAVNLSTYDDFALDTRPDGLAAFATNLAARYAAVGVSRSRPIVVYEDDTRMRARLGAPGFTLLDVRDVNENAGRDKTACCARRGRIPGSVWIEWTSFLRDGRYKEPGELRSLLAERGVDPESEIVPYCHRGARSANTYYALQRAGLEKVRNYIGSWHEWSSRADLPIEGHGR